MSELPPFSFDLAKQPCIPVLDSGGKPDILSLRDMLVRAHELSEIQHDSPVVTAALVRLCVALLTDIYPLKRPSQWQALWLRRAFDTAVIDAYFEQHKNRFDLFHEKYPFYQCAALEDDAPVNMNLMASELSTGNNPTLFDHSLDTLERDYCPAEAFQMLVATQSFALAGLLRRTTRLKGEAEPLYWQSAYNGALVPGEMIWLTGNSLFETLCLNLTPLERLDSEDDNMSETEEDRPIWRQDRPELLRDRQGKKGLEKITPRGPRDHLTLQSRLIRLMPEWSEGEIVVRRAAFTHGRSLNASAQNTFDPMLAYRPSKKEGWLVTRLSAERASWRDAHALMGLNEKQNGQLQRVTPRALHLLHTLLPEKIVGLEPGRLLRLNVAGLANDQAKILLWRHDRLDAPAKVLSDPDMANRVGFLLNEAEEVAYALRTATRRLCELFLAPYAVDARGKQIEGAMRADPDRVTALADAIDARSSYWARLESAFHHLLLRIGDNPDAASEEWKNRVESEARLAFAEEIANLGDCPQTGKAVALVNGYFLVPSRQTKPVAGKTTRSKPKEKSA